MRSFRLMYAALLIVLFVISLYACGGSGGGNSTSNGAITDTTPTDENGNSGEDSNDGEPIIIPVATIEPDGSTGDWTGISPLTTDLQGDSSSSYTGDDIKAIYVAKDANNLYIRMDLWENANTGFGNGPSPNDGDYRFRIESDSAGDASLAIDPNNKVHIAYKTPVGLKYATNSAGTWQISTLIQTHLMQLHCHCERSEAISNEFSGLLRRSAPRNDTQRHFIYCVCIRCIMDG